MLAILYELQKRYLGSFPLVKEEMCFENLMNSKEESYALTSLVLDMKTSSILNEDEFDENIQIVGSREGSHRITSRMQVRVDVFLARKRFLRNFPLLSRKFIVLRGK